MPGNYFKIKGSIGLNTLDNKLIEQKCYHCGDNLSSTIWKDGLAFCCTGCASVYEILSKNTLCDYYKLSRRPGIKPSPDKESWDFLDLPEVETALIQYRRDFETHISFKVPRMHCISCLWLLENLNKIHAGILHTKVNFYQKSLYIVFDKRATGLKEIVQTLHRIGYEPALSYFHVLNPMPESQKINHRVIKIGVAGFCFANIMMLSLPSYLGIDPLNDPLIYYSSIIYAYLLIIPVLVYAASEFYLNAWKSVKYKWVNIDLPIALALTVTFGRSLFETIAKAEIGYLDSLSGIVFFMLIGRYLQEKTTTSAVFDRDYKSFIPIAVHKRDGMNYTPILASKIKKNDIIKIYDQETCPVDGCLITPKAQVDYSFVTGESEPVQLFKNDTILAGGKSVGGSIEVKVTETMSESYLNHLWTRFNYDSSQWNQRWVDTLSQWFTILILVVTTLAGLYWLWRNEMDTMWNVMTTTLIVICPCTLLLASSFTYGHLIKIFSKSGLYLKNAGVVDRLAKISHIVFDKTGTLTETHSVRITYEGKPFSEETKAMIKCVLDQSGHIYSKMISKQLNNSIEMNPDSFREVKGQGIEGWVSDTHIKIGSAIFTGARDFMEKRNGSKVFISINRQLIGCFIIEQQYRKGIGNLINKLKTRYRIALISGDNDSELPRLKNWFGSEPMLFNRKPEDKIAFIQSLKAIDPKTRTLMIGDGLNDAGAFKEADCSIAILDQQHQFTPASDAILEARSLPKLDEFLSLARKAKSIIYSAFFASGLYNIVGLYFALQGRLNPLLAAIIMPLSSLTIIGLSYWMSNYHHKKYIMK